MDIDIENFPDDPATLKKMLRQVCRAINIVLYDYHNSRDGQCAADFLDGYNGYLQVDGYQGYEQTQATLIGCWVHARRKFMEAKKGSGKADWALNHIQKLYRIETQLKDKAVRCATLPDKKRACRCSISSIHG